MKKILIKIFLFFIILILGTKVYANNLNVNEIYSNYELQKYIEESEVNIENINVEQLIEMYTDLSSGYSNQEIANIILDNKEEIINEVGIDESTLKTGTDFLRTMNTEETKKILREDINVQEIQQKLNEGYSPKQIIKEMQREMDTYTKLKITVKVLFASLIVKVILLVLLIISLYKIIIRWIIFKKAGKHGFASIIPIYNEITYLNVCNINPFWILILIIPVIGWLIYGIVKIISKFTLAEAFERGIGFGFGLLIFKIIFESIIAFNKNIKYIEFEE